jgi:phosphatidylserine/phosphatidylglycerophosphate/cardiolipin synthase-like enzyme
MPLPNHPDFSSYELGTAHEPLEVDTSGEVRDACLTLIRQARREVIIMSRNLDATLFDNVETSTALREFILQSRRSSLRILVKDPEPAVRAGHRLIELTQRLSSFAEIRVPTPEHGNYNAAFLVADGRGVVHRGFADRYEATVCFSHPGLAGECVRHFDEMWDTARNDPALRRTYL